MTETKRTFPWPEDEIVASYRSALDKKAQIKILADLNVCKVQDCTRSRCEPCHRPELVCVLALRPKQ